MTILLAASGAHVTERSFKRVEHADLEELYSNALQNVSVNSLATCSTLCSQNVDCKSYAWTNYSSQCSLLSEDVRRTSFYPLIPPDIAVYTTCRYCSDDFKKTLFIYIYLLLLIDNKFRYVPNHATILS